MSPKLFAVLALAALAASPALAPAGASSISNSMSTTELPEVPSIDPFLAGPVTGATLGGPASSFLIPPGAPTGPPVPGYGLLFAIPGYSQMTWELHAGGYKWRCNTVFGRGEIYIDGLNQRIATGTCTGRMGSTGVDYVVSFARSTYATVVADMGGVIVAAPMPL